MIASITVFTPKYNREHMVDQLYQSLLRNTNLNLKRYWLSETWKDLLQHVNVDLLNSSQNDLLDLLLYCHHKMCWFYRVDKSDCPILDNPEQLTCWRQTLEKTKVTFSYANRAAHMAKVLGI